MVDEGRVVSGEALAQIRAGRNVCGWHDGSDVTFPADASLPLVPPSVLAHDLNERRALWGDHWERCSRSRVLDVPGPLINGSPTVVRERLSVGDAQLRARNFMLRWLVCARCNAAFNPEQFRYWNVQPDDDEISRDAWYPRAAVQRPPDHHFKQVPQASARRSGSAGCSTQEAVAYGGLGQVGIEKSCKAVASRQLRPHRSR
jgi:hypothetical protein